MLPAFVLLAPPAPSGTTTAKVLSDWLTQATGVPHAFGGELRDYPVFLSLHTNDPKRIEMLVAIALAGEWTQDGSTLRLLPVKPKGDEGLAEFARGWKAATVTRPNFAALPARDLYAMQAGEILRFGTGDGPYVRPLPDALRKKVEASDVKTGWVYVRRFSNGCFETKVEMPDEHKGVFSGDTQVEFRNLPPEVTAALGEEAKKAALGAEDVTALGKIAANPGAVKLDPKSIDATDPLARFVDPVLKPMAQALKEDLVVALPDMAIMGLMGEGKSTVEGVMKAFCLFDDWTSVPGAFVGRLPVSERRNRAQTRRNVMAEFIRSTRDVGVPGPATLAEYLAGQRPPASEGWTDVMMLVMSGVTLDQTHVGDYPFNLRLGAALTEGDWARLRSGKTLTMPELSLAVRAALLTLLVSSRQRMGSDGPDPVRWRGFPNVPLTLTAKVEDEDVLLGFRGGLTDVMTPRDGGYGYRYAAKALGAEPLYRPGHRRKLTLTVANPAEGEPVETGFADVSVDPKAQAVPWTELPAQWSKPFGEALKQRDAQEPPPGSPKSL